MSVFISLVSSCFNSSSTAKENGLEMDQQLVLERTRRWIASVVIGLNLCPFAQRVFQAEKIRYVVSDAEEETTLLEELKVELEFLVSCPVSQIETTLLIHPRVLRNFLDYNDFLGT